VISQFSYKIEIIIVDDGSSDDSFKLAKKYLRNKKKFHKVKFLKHSKNLGPGSARNTGIKNSTGEYIAFLDSDDILVKGFSANIKNLIKKNIYEIIEYGFIRFENKIALEEFNHLYSFSGAQSFNKIKLELFSKTV